MSLLNDLVIEAVFRQLRIASTEIVESLSAKVPIGNPRKVSQPEREDATIPERTTGDEIASHFFIGLFRETFHSPRIPRGDGWNYVTVLLAGIRGLHAHQNKLGKITLNNVVQTNDVVVIGLLCIAINGHHNDSVIFVRMLFEQKVRAGKHYCRSRITALGFKH